VVGRQVGVRGHRCLRRVLPARCLIFRPFSRHHHHRPSFKGVAGMFSWCLLLLVPCLGTPFAPPGHLVLSPEERDKKGITGILSFFSLQASRHLLGLKLVIPLLMFFIPCELYLYGMFLMKKGMFARSFVRGRSPRQGVNPCYF
jgi:hypothetical protein